VSGRSSRARSNPRFSVLNGPELERLQRCEAAIEREISGPSINSGVCSAGARASRMPPTVNVNVSSDGGD